MYKRFAYLRHSLRMSNGKLPQNIIRIFYVTGFYINLHTFICDNFLSVLMLIRMNKYVNPG